MENIYSPPIGALFEPIAIAAQNGLAALRARQPDGMSALADAKRRLRERPSTTCCRPRCATSARACPARSSRTGARRALWRWLFVPLYRRLPWAVKRRAMDALRMTASGWTPPERRPGEPWRPPQPPV